MTEDRRYVEDEVAYHRAEIRRLRLANCKDCGKKFRYTSECFSRCMAGAAITDNQNRIDRLLAVD